MKTLLLLILCIPFALACFEEVSSWKKGAREFERSEITIPVKTEETLRQALEVSLKLSRNAAHEAQIRLLEEAQANSGSSELATMVTEHANLLGNSVVLIESYSRNNSSAARWKSSLPVTHPYQKLLVSRQVIIEKVKRISDLQKRYPNERTELLKELEDYERLLGGSNAYAESVRSYMTRYDLHARELGDIHELLEATVLRTDRTNRGQAKDKVRKGIESLNKYAMQYRSIQQEYEWAQSQIALWQKALTLISISEEESSRSAVDVIARYGQIVKEEQVGSQLRIIAQKGARRFCELYLPPKVNLDAYVVLINPQTGVPERVKRDEVKIVWKNRAKNGGRFPTLSESGYDEFTLPENDVDKVLVNQASRELPIKCTTRSRACHVYNIARARVVWSVSSLETLLKECAEYQEDLGETWSRITDLVEAGRSYPSLFESNQ